ncbi:AlbA family DNA-binding domain-containing protein [Williamsia muralis]|uniref:ATP-binding protein n=1 Tax=Williamsia marianensis TaxID=85044 RepID=A0ABU4F2I3_WILMA|nr:ATP-binding protein [Williamsia muralis]MDV7137097.1 ATP-binding protein [Williamsia muralis]
MSIVVDGRTDAEKLRELLGQAEQQALEYKAALDLTDHETKLNFVKDAVAMGNTGGGYILVGVNDDGHACAPSGSIDQSRFDPARLNDIFRKYTRPIPKLVSQLHPIDGNEVMLVFVPPTSGPPLPMIANGDYNVPKKTKQYKFRKGDVPVREGAQNVALDYSHWPALLARHDEAIRERTRRDIDVLIGRLVGGQQAVNPSLLPLDPGLDEAAFAYTLVSHLESSTTHVPIKTFVLEAGERALRAADEDTTALDQLTIIGTHAALYQNEQVYGWVVDQLHKIYLELKVQDSRKKLAIVDRVYVLGSCLVRLGYWGDVRTLVLQSPADAVYPSWIREGQVAASRDHLYPDDKTGLMISAARQLMVQHPAMRPDLPTIQPVPEDLIGRRDALLNTLCQFDILYCVVVAADSLKEGPGMAEGYPASAAFDQNRVNPMLEQLVTDHEIRNQLLPQISDTDLSSALHQMWERAHQEAMKNGGFWFSLPPRVVAFMEAHPPQR